MTWFVHRRDGAIVSAHQKIQPGYADEALADDNPELFEFLDAPKRAAKERADARNAALDVVKGKGSGSVTREEFEALKEAVAKLIEG